ncbi:AAA family ATPase [Streptomyces rubiginosohelvolus]|uniref:AAA family ATPase n=1 Tax=Streptomyces TaxID=1883 RepID=UPI001CD1F9EF|nr:AAA family ATPase [Streptomyces sp. 7G]MCA1270048.1 AAA family ATPase [Streptomyces sp. 7G]
MRLQRIYVHNFKLLQDIRIDLSTDPQRPLTVIRAENGSGKTSLHYAILWGLYGVKGLQEVTRAERIRLTSTASPLGKPVAVEVSLEFEVEDDGGPARYRLQRTVIETPAEGDEVERGQEVVRLSLLTGAGGEHVALPEQWIEQRLPERLADVFFTNGDDVQKFITGRQHAHERQLKVHEAIENLLGIGKLRRAVEDAAAVYQIYEKRAAKDAGAKVEGFSDQKDELRRKSDELNAKIEKLSSRQKNMEAAQSQDRRDLDAIKGIGDLEVLNAQIAELERDCAALETRKTECLHAMSALLCDEVTSWSLMNDALTAGLGRLDELKEMRVIPSHSVQVLHDCLEAGECICGEPLEPGSSSREHVQSLLDEQQDKSAVSKYLSEARYRAHALRETGSQPDRFPARRTQLLSEYAQIIQEIKRKGTSLNASKERRGQIDDEKVRRLQSDLNEREEKIKETIYELGVLGNQAVAVEQETAAKQKQLEKAQREAKISADISTKRDVATDLKDLASAVRDRLEGDYVKQVSTRLQKMFHGIIGSDNSSTQGVYTGVTITNSFDIKVMSQQGTSLDPDFEINGASQRALTLSFVWSLMEVAGVVAPRFIDTPLGMVSGDTKRRMIEAITRPPGPSETPFQVVLLLTRSEIAGIEDILDERAGSFLTLSCSHHHPQDLVNNWLVDYPVSRTCTCTHREICDVCARRRDDEHLRYREQEASL